ncbi:hypothetical protein SETIT_8G246600v2 [Setaria italica]|uniref:Ubiquitin-like domain-containing protein n=2 Tax=Setaria italica TaxID=4555 RepID=A0A368SBI9_SETIT|nr:hypothetical protein SETIT_8G246600v2 [Setaria italica]
MVVRRRRRLLAQLGALADGDKQGHGIHLAVAGRPEHTLAEEMPTTLYHLPGRVHDPTEHARVEIKWPLDNSIEDLPFYLHDPRTVKLLAENTKHTWEEAYGDTMEIWPMLFLVIEEKASAPASAIVEGTKRSIYNSVVDEALSVFAVASWRDHNTLLNAAMEMSTTLYHLPCRVHDPTEHARVEIKWPLDNSIEDLPFYLHDPRIVKLLAQNAKTMWEEAYGDAMETLPMLFLVIEEKASAPASAIVEGTKRSIHNSIVDEALSVFAVASWRDHNTLLSAAMMLPREDVDVNKAFFRLAELSSRSSLTSNISADCPQDIDRQQLDACSKSDIQIEHNDECKMVDASRTKCKMVPIFVHHCSGKVVLAVNLEEPSEHMMHMYEKKTKMKLTDQYFIYGNHRIDPKCSLLSYGVGRNAIVIACSRLLGGKPPTLAKYCDENKGKFVRKVTRPDGEESVDMEKKGCRILSSLLKCFTKTFAKGKSWAGQFTLEYFKVVNEHVKVLIIARLNLDSYNLKADLRGLVRLIRGMLLVLLRKKYKSLRQHEQLRWEQIMMEAVMPKNADLKRLSKLAVFKDIIAKAESLGKGYQNRQHSLFGLMRDEFTHGVEHRFDKSVKPWKEKFKDDDGIELMIPAHLDDLAARIIWCLVRNSIDITAELLACQVRCYCPHCREKTSDMTKATGPKPSDSKEATGLGLSSCAKGGTDSGPSQQAESSIKKGNPVSHAAASKKGPSQQAESSMKERTPVSFPVPFASLFKPALKPPSSVPPQKPQSSEANKPKPQSSKANKPKSPPPEDDGGFQIVKSKKGTRRR